VWLAAELAAGPSQDSFSKISEFYPIVVEFLRHCGMRKIRVEAKDVSV